MTRIEKLKEIFGEEFAQKYITAKQIAEIKRNKELISEAIDALKNHDGSFKAKVRNYDVLLAEVPMKLKGSKTSVGNYRFSLLWYGKQENPWITVFVVDPEDAFKLENLLGEQVILIGRLSEKEGDVRFRCISVISLEEVLSDAPQSDRSNNQ